MQENRDSELTGWTKRHQFICGAIAAVAVCAFAWHAARFFPNAQGLIGADYSWFLPTLVAGDFWFQQNSILHLPYFTPAFCGGVLLLGNPQSVVYSVPQLLLAFVDPVKATLATLVLFATIGAVGTYLLLVRCFRRSMQAGVLGAVLFLLNGFLFHRVVIGHLPYHAFGLLPMLAWLVLRSHRAARGGQPARTSQLVTAMVLGGGLVAYITYGGALNFEVPIFLTVTCLLLVMQAADGRDRAPWAVLIGSGVWGAALSAVKLAPAAVLASQFPRPYLPSYLFRDPLELLRLLVSGLFLPGALPDLVRFGAIASLGRHEFELGLSLVPLALIVTATPRHLWTRARLAQWRESPFTAAALIVLLTLPLVLTFGPWRWGVFLLEVPVINSNTTFVRWWSIYLLPLIALAAWCFDALVRTPSGRTALLLGCSVLAMGQQLAIDSPYYTQRDNTYDPSAVLAAYTQARSGGGIPAIEGIASAEVARGSAAAQREHLNDPFTQGRSSWPCYEPLFGYTLELAPDLGLHEGAVQENNTAGLLNLVDPATYLERQPGRQWRFASSRLPAAMEFAAYRDYPWQVPSWQTAAAAVTLSALVLSVLYLLALGVVSRSPHARVAASHTQRPA